MGEIDNNKTNFTNSFMEIKLFAKGKKKHYQYFNEFKQRKTH